MDGEGKLTKVTLTKADIEKMGPQAFNRLLLRAAKVRAKGVVRDKDGNIRYDRPELAGTYGEEHLQD